MAIEASFLCAGSERVDSGGARPFDSFVLSLSKDEHAQDMLQPCQATLKGCPTATRNPSAVPSGEKAPGRFEAKLHSRTIQ